MTMTPEFSRPVRLDRIGSGASSESIEADATERAALAKRFGLIAIDRLEARFSLRREGDTVGADGKLTAAVVQACVATGDPVPARIDTDFALRFVPAREEPVEEIELDAEELDTIDYSGSAIDLGEAAAETLALALDPYPRSDRAGEVLAKVGVLSEDEAKEASNPFAALARFRKD